MIRNDELISHFLTKIMTNNTGSKIYEALVTTKGKLESQLPCIKAKHNVPVTHFNVKQNHLLLQYSECCFNTCPVLGSWHEPARFILPDTHKVYISDGGIITSTPSCTVRILVICSPSTGTA